MNFVLNKCTGFFLSLAFFDADRELFLAVSGIGTDRDIKG